MQSTSRSCVCTACGAASTHVHGTYRRRVQDLPIFGKGVELLIRAKEYWCDNPLCSVTTLAETYGNFIGYYGRMTDRLETFICTLALETNCEGCASICKAMNIRTSGDSIIRMILRKYAEQPEPICGSVIGVDDFAFKKRQTYGTIIVDGETHSPISLLEGRDKETLKQWLKQNPLVQTISVTVRVHMHLQSLSLYREQCRLPIVSTCIKIFCKSAECAAWNTACES